MDHVEQGGLRHALRRAAPRAAGRASSCGCWSAPRRCRRRCADRPRPGLARTAGRSCCDTERREHVDQRDRGVLVRIGQRLDRRARWRPRPRSLSLATAFSVSAPSGSSDVLICVISRSDRRFVKKLISASGGDFLRPRIMPHSASGPGGYATGPHCARISGLIDPAISLDSARPTSPPRARARASTPTPTPGSAARWASSTPSRQLVTSTPAELRVCSCALPVPVGGYADELAAALAPRLAAAGIDAARAARVCRRASVPTPCRSR